MRKIFFFMILPTILLWKYNLNAQTDYKYCDSLLNAGIEKIKETNYLKALELFTEAHTLAKSNHPELLFSVKNDIGICYFYLLDYGESLKYFLEAYNLALSDKNSTNELRVLSNIAIIYTSEKDYKRAYSYFKRAYDISKKEDDPAGICIYALNIGMVLNDMNNAGQSRKYLEESLRNNKEKSQYNDLLARTGIAESEMLNGNIREARNMAMSVFPEVPEKEKQIAVKLLLITSKCYLQEKKYKDALHYAIKALNYDGDLETKRTIYEMLADISAETGSLEKVITYKDSVYAIQGRLNDIKNGRTFENNRVKFEMQDYKNQISLKEATITHDRKLFYFVIGGMATLLLLIFFIFRNLSMKHKQKKLVAENNQQVLALKLAKSESESLLQEKEFREKQHEILLEQERLKNEIEHKNRQLSSKALYASGKYQMIEEVISLLSNQPEVAELPAVQKHIRFLRNSLKTTDEWENFLTHFEEVNQGFLTRLKANHPDLTANDIRFICYVYMNLNAKEIATMLNISLDAGRKRKERIAQKLGLKDSTSLYSYLYDI